MQITHELGAIESVSRSRIITAEEETLIAQLTMTVLRDSPVERANIWLSTSVRRWQVQLPTITTAVLRQPQCETVTDAQQ